MHFFFIWRNVAFKCLITFIITIAKIKLNTTTFSDRCSISLQQVEASIDTTGFEVLSSGISAAHIFLCVFLIFKVTNADCIITRFQFNVTFQCCRTCVIGSNYADALTCCYNSSFTFASVSLSVLSSAIYKPMHGNFYMCIRINKHCKVLFLDKCFSRKVWNSD